MYSFRWKLWKKKVTSQLGTCPQLLNHSWVPLYRILSSLRNMFLSARIPCVPLSRILSSLRDMSLSESCPWVPQPLNALCSPSLRDPPRTHLEDIYIALNFQIILGSSLKFSGNWALYVSSKCIKSSHIIIFTCFFNKLRVWSSYPCDFMILLW